MSLQNLVKKKKLSIEDEVLWDLFTENLNSYPKKKKDKASIKSKNNRKNIKKFNELKFGQGEALSKKNLRNLNKGNVLIENKLDLHGFKEIEAKNSLEDFINKSVENNLRLVLVITGKGKEGEGKIKKNILFWLNEEKLRNKILAINYASKKHGGSGAIYVFLRKF